MDSRVVRLAAVFLVLAYVSAIVAALRPVLYNLTFVGVTMAVGMLLLERAAERRRTRRRLALRRPLLAEWRPTYAGCF